MPTPVAEAMSQTEQPRTRARREIIYRHAWPVRLTHWINALTIFIMVGSGLNIFDAHPRLYWGQAGADFDKPFLTLGPWPDWLTLPSYMDLADARHWHFFFAWILVLNGALYLAWSLASSPHFKANGTLDPGGEEYERHVAQGFVNWHLQIDGMVAHPLTLSVADLRRLPSRSQITRHDCVEGWSAIGGWTGVPLALLLRAAGVRAGAKYVVFYCADNLDGDPAKGGEQSPGQYYESIGLTDAMHPQTIIAYDMNGKPLDVAHGAPLRLRVERQLGYKMAKYVRHIQLVSDFSRIAGGHGGYWEDHGYDWYAGI